MVVDRTSRFAACLALVAIVSVVGCAGSAGNATPPSTSAPYPTAAPTQPVDLQGVLDHRRETYGAPGAVLAIDIAGVRQILVSGARDIAGDVLTPNDRFRIASITKPIVAALVLDAVAQGQLTLDDTVANILPGVVRGEPAITVRQVLDHTSGVFDEGNEGDPIADVEQLTDPAIQNEARDVIERWQAGERVIAPDRVIVALAETHDRYNLPGLGYHYSNPNYQIAAMFLEKVTGKPLGKLLADRIAMRLDLERTTVAPPDLDAPEMRGYQQGDDMTLTDVTDDFLGFGNGGNGGIKSTAGEVLTVMEAIVSGRLFPAELVTQMKTSTLGSYGLGLGKYSFTCGPFYGHEGSVNGTRSVAVVSDDGSSGVVIALNANTPSEPELPLVAERMICPSLAN